MHSTSVPLILSSLSFLLPYFAAVETGNSASAAAWGTLAVTSTLVHITKEPFHIHGPGNVIPWLYAVDVVALYIATARGCYDAWMSGSVLPWIAGTTVAYANVMFYAGQHTGRFVYDAHLDTSILSHLTTHLLAAWAGTAAIYSRAFKNG
jgi:hypothetical protein